MIHHQEIWDCVRNRLPKGQWLQLEYIYGLINETLTLNKDDFEGQTPNSSIPKWKRNVRNVLQYRKATGEIEWHKHKRGLYRLQS